MAVLGIYVRCLGCNTPRFLWWNFLHSPNHCVIKVWAHYDALLSYTSSVCLATEWGKMTGKVASVGSCEWFKMIWKLKKITGFGVWFFRGVVGGFLDNHFEMYETLAKLGDSQSQEYAWWNQECCWVWTCIASEYRMTLKIVNLKSEKNNNVIPEHVCLSKHGGFCKRKLYRNVQASLQSSHLEQHKYLFWIHAS